MEYCKFQHSNALKRWNPWFNSSAMLRSRLAVSNKLFRVILGRWRMGFLMLYHWKTLKHHSWHHYFAFLMNRVSSRMVEPVFIHLNLESVGCPGRSTFTSMCFPANETSMASSIFNCHEFRRVFETTEARGRAGFLHGRQGTWCDECLQPWGFRPLIPGTSLVGPGKWLGKWVETWVVNDGLVKWLEQNRFTDLSVFTFYQPISFAEHQTKWLKHVETRSAIEVANDRHLVGKKHLGISWNIVGGTSHMPLADVSRNASFSLSPRMP